MSKPHLIHAGSKNGKPVFQVMDMPRTRLEDPYPRVLQVPMRQAGIRVDHDTALKYSAVFASVRVIAETVASLSWHVMQSRPDGGRERLIASPIESVLNIRPNPEMGPFSFKETLLFWALIWGNGYAEIVRDMAGRVVELWPIAPDRVEVMRAPDDSLVYEISNTSEGKTYLPPRDVFHIHGPGFDGRVGYSVISLAARSIGAGLAAEEFVVNFYGNNTVVGGVLEHPMRLSDEAYKRIRDSWEERHQGPTRAGKPAILEEGMKWHALGMPMEDAQFIESRQFQVTDIARWFRVPPHKIGDLTRSTFSNIEQQAIEFVTDAIVPWAIRLEQEADYKLFGINTRGRQFTKLNLNSLLRGDSESRAKFYKEMANLGVFTINIILQLEDMNPIGPEGDQRFMQMNMTTIERIINGEYGDQGEEQPTPEKIRIRAIKGN